MSGVTQVRFCSSRKYPALVHEISMALADPSECPSTRELELEIHLRRLLRAIDQDGLGECADCPMRDLAQRIVDEAGG